MGNKIVRTVDVVGSSRPVTYLNADGEEELVGHYRADTYGDDNVLNHLFQPAGEKIWKSLGSSKQGFKFVNHTDVMEPIMEAGWQIQDQLVGKNGADVFTVFSNPDGERYKDLVSWDLPLWNNAGGSNTNELGTLQEGLVLSTSIRPGKALKMNIGLFRLVCTNGLIIEALDLGSTKMNHRTFKLENITDILSERDRVDGFRGEYVGKPTAILGVQDLLTRQWAGDLPENEIPFFLRNELSTLSRLPKWYQEPLQDFLDHMVNVDGNIHMLDVLNATTGALNYTRQVDGGSDHAFDRVFTSMDPITEKLSNLLGIFSLN